MLRFKMLQVLSSKVNRLNPWAKVWPIKNGQEGAQAHDRVSPGP